MLAAKHCSMPFLNSPEQVVRFLLCTRLVYVVDTSIICILSCIILFITSLTFNTNNLFYSPHPYIFFNHDRFTMTFLGFRINQNGDLLDPGKNTVLEKKLMDPTLRGQLKHQGVDFDADYEKRNRLT